MTLNVALPLLGLIVTTEPSLSDGVAKLRSDGSRRLTALPWFLAPGRLLDRGIDLLASSGVTQVSGPLAFDSRIDQVVLRRYDEQIAHDGVTRDSRIAVNR